MATFKIRNRLGVYEEVQLERYSRNGTKSPTLELYVRTNGGSRITPFEFRVRGYSIDLNNLFKMVYGDVMEKLVPDSLELMSLIIKDESHGSLYHIPVVLGEEHGVI
jgi:hypothetical protein